jgi:hypothetical protein
MMIGDEARTLANNRLEVLNDRLEALAGKMTSDQQLLVKVVETQSELRPLIARLADVADQDGFGIDEASRRHLRGIDEKIGQLQFRSGGAPVAGGGGADISRQVIDSFEALNTYLANHQQLLLRLSETQAETMQHVGRLVEIAERSGVGLDDRTRQHIRSIDSQLARQQEQSVPAHIQALLVQTAESLDSLQRSVVGGEELRLQSEQRLMTLNDSMTKLAGSLTGDRTLFARLSETQEALRPVLAKLADSGDRGAGGGVDEATRHHIRNIDAYLARMLEELSIGRQYTVQELRNEIKLLARTIAQAAGATEQ